MLETYFLHIYYQKYARAWDNKKKKGGDRYMGIIVTLILAGIIGWIASMIMHTDGQMGWVSNIIAGIVGGVIGTSLLGFIAPASPTDNGFSLMGIIVGIIGACIAIFLWQLLTGRKAV